MPPALAARLPGARRADASDARRPPPPAPCPRFAHAVALHRAIFGGQLAARSTPRRCASCAPASSICSAAATTGTCRCCARCSTPCSSARAAAGARPSTSALWLNLAGYCLRPGLGDALDDWRIEQLWALFGRASSTCSESNNWSEWWTLWRRAPAA
jgi:hypothetical protein